MPNKQKSKIQKSKLFEIYEDNRSIYTINMIPGIKVYDEKLIKEKNIEYREWNPKKSKLAAAIKKGSPNIFIRKGSVVLYLGSASGTTASHVSDIVGREGFVFAVDPAPIVMRKLIFNCEKRNNIAPILADAREPEQYLDKTCKVNIIYQDIAQKNQLEIFKKNIDIFLKNDGYAMIAIKARSIDVTKNPRTIFKDVRKKLENDFIIIDYRVLDPFEKDHCFFIVKKK